LSNPDRTQQSYFDKLPMKSVLSWVGLVLLAGWAVLSLVLAIRNTFTPLGGNDLYTYWYAGLFIRQSDDPYAAFIAHQQPDLPITFLDGEAHSIDEIKIPGLVPAPANTYPLVYLLTLFSFLTWPTAKVAWLICNLVLVLIIPILLTGLIPARQQLDRRTMVILALVFIGFTSSRYALSSGQLSFLVFGMLLGSALLVKQRPWLAGILMGFALSKYSLALGFFLYYLFFERRLRMSLTAILVQVLGVGWLVLTSGSSVTQVLEEYRLLFEHHARMEGIQLSALLSTGGSNPPLSAGFTLLIGAFLMRYALKNPVSRQADPLVRLCLLTILLLWSLLVGYHRSYDALTFILFLALAVSMLHDLRGMPEAHGLHFTWKSFSILSAAIMLLPAGSLVRAGLPEGVGRGWIILVSKLTSLVLIFALVLCIYTLLSWLGENRLRKRALDAGMIASTRENQ
jgi:hypothetical protein